MTLPDAFSVFVFVAAVAVHGRMFRFSGTSKLGQPCQWGPPYDCSEGEYCESSRCRSAHCSSHSDCRNEEEEEICSDGHCAKNCTENCEKTASSDLTGIGLIQKENMGNIHVDARQYQGYEDKCRAKQPMDVVLVLDESSSMGTANFNKMKSFVKALVKDFNLKSGMVQVSTVLYSGKEDINLLNDCVFMHDKENFDHMLDSVKYSGGLTATGVANEGIDPVKAATILRQDNVDIYSVGILCSYSYLPMWQRLGQQLVGISGNEANVFRALSFGHLNVQLRNNLVSAICGNPVGNEERPKYSTPYWPYKNYPFKAITNRVSYPSYQTGNQQLTQYFTGYPNKPPYQASFFTRSPRFPVGTTTQYPTRPVYPIQRWTKPWNQVITPQQNYGGNKYPWTFVSYPPLYTSQYSSLVVSYPRYPYEPYPVVPPYQTTNPRPPYRPPTYTQQVNQPPTYPPSPNQPPTYQPPPNPPRTYPPAPNQQPPNWPPPRQQPTYPPPPPRQPPTYPPPPRQPPTYPPPPRQPPTYPPPPRQPPTYPPPPRQPPTYRTQPNQPATFEPPPNQPPTNPPPPNQPTTFEPPPNQPPTYPPPATTSVPLSTTSMPTAAGPSPTATMATTSSTEVCALDETKLDVAFVIDHSSSVGTKNFAKMNDFIGSMMDTFPVDSGQAKIGMVPYSTKPFKVQGLNKYKTNADLKGGLMNTKYKRGRTATGEALRSVREKVYGKRGARDDAKKIVIVVTDGVSNTGVAPGIAADELRADGAEVFAIGIKGASRKELDSMAGGKNDHVIEVPDFDDLEVSITQQIMQSVCSHLKTARDYTETR